MKSSSSCAVGRVAGGNAFRVAPPVGENAVPRRGSRDQRRGVRRLLLSMRASRSPGAGVRLPLHRACGRAGGAALFFCVLAPHRFNCRRCHFSRRAEIVRQGTYMYQIVGKQVNSHAVDSFLKTSNCAQLSHMCRNNFALSLILSVGHTVHITGHSRPFAPLVALHFGHWTFGAA